jgi:hypothetical protein
MIENQLNLSYPFIHIRIGLIFGADSTDLTNSRDWTKSGEVKIVKLYWEGPSLLEVIPENLSRGGQQ